MLLPHPALMRWSTVGGVIVEQIIRPTGLIDPEVEVRPANTQVDDFVSVAHEVIKKGFRVLATWPDQTHG